MQACAVWCEGAANSPFLRLLGASLPGSVLTSFRAEMRMPGTKSRGMVSCEAQSHPTRHAYLLIRQTFLGWFMQKTNIVPDMGLGLFTEASGTLSMG